MRVLLINPLDIQQKKEGTVFFQLFEKLKRIRVLPSLGLSYIAAYLREHGIEVSILDANALRLGPEEVAPHVRRVKPDVVGVTVTTPVFRPALQVCEKVKEVDPAITTVMGGVHVTVLPRETLLHDCVDFGVIGEGEAVMLRLVQCLADGKPWADIPGLVHRQDGEVHANPPGERIRDLDGLPLPARDLLPLQQYHDATTPSYRAMSMVTSRGCPFRCAFCEREVRGGHFHTRGAEKVVDEIAELVNRYGFREILFYDDTFTVNKKRVKEICEGILARNLRFSWDCRSRVDTVSQEMLHLMKRAGCTRISFGIESASQEVLDNLNKGITVEDAREAVRMAKEAGIDVLAYFMLGSPGETRQSVDATLRLAKELRPEFAYYSITVGYPGSDLYEQALERGVVLPDYWERYVRDGGILPGPLPYFVNGEVTREYLDEMQKKAYKDFYLRPQYVASRLRHVRSVKDFVWHARMARNLFLTG